MIKDKIRTLLNIRTKREMPPVGPKPRAGRRITLGRHRMLVTSAPPDDLWFFLSLQGWREVAITRDRRRYVDMPRASMDLLARSQGTEREVRYQQLLAQAARNQPRAETARATTPA